MKSAIDSPAFIEPSQNLLGSLMVKHDHGNAPKRGRSKETAMMTWWNSGAGNGYGGWWGSGIGMMLMMLLVWLPIVSAGIWLVARVTRPSSAHVTHSMGGMGTPMTYGLPSARGTLDRRFANGDITAEQYAEMRRNLDR